MRPRVLQALCQRPAQTGSGVTLEALARHGARDFEMAAVVGIPGDAPAPSLDGISRDRVFPLRFDTPELPFPVVGMSDVMPYPSTRFSDLSPERAAAYRAAWQRHLAEAVQRARPHLLHGHHVWLMTATLARVAPELPLVAHCHATGLRQRLRCPHLAAEVAEAIPRIHAFVTVSRETARALSTDYGVPPERVHVVGAGFREDRFHPGAPGSPRLREGNLIYVGKLARAKGVPWLLEAFARIVTRRPAARLRLHVVGSGAGPEAEAIRARMAALAPHVVAHGQVDQSTLADLLRRCHLCVLPSFYEGVPLVLVEALACGCRLVATDLPGVAAELAPHLGDALHRVALPRLRDADTPAPEDLPAFVDRLEAALDAALAAPPPADVSRRVAPFTWQRVYDRVAAVWRRVLGDPADSAVSVQSGSSRPG